MPSNTPQQFKLLDLKISRLINNIFLGNYKTAFKGSGIEFADLREYVAGDSFRFIDWTITAKQGKLFIKKYEEERQLTIFFLIDISQSMQFGLEDSKKINTLQEVFYLLALSALKNNDRIGAILYDQNIQALVNPAKSKATLLQVLNNIEQHQTNSSCASNTEKALKLLNSLKYKNCLTFVLTDNLEIQEQQIYKLAGYKNELVYINIFDHFENTLNQTGIFNFKQQNKFLEINLNDQNKKKEYQQLRQQKIDTLRNFLRQKRIDYLALDNQSNLFKEFFNYFRLKASRQ